MSTSSLATSTYESKLHSKVNDIKNFISYEKIPQSLKNYRLLLFASFIGILALVFATYGMSSSSK